MSQVRFRDLSVTFISTINLSHNVSVCALIQFISYPERLIYTNRRRKMAIHLFHLQTITL